jgi:hypothetical protein
LIPHQIDFTILPLPLILLLSARVAVVVESREIVTTQSWQLLGENNTIPARLHMQMDMITGEKWAWLFDVDDNDDNDNGADNGFGGDQQLPTASMINAVGNP